MRSANVDRLMGIVQRLSLPVYVAAKYNGRVRRLLATLREREPIDVVWAEYTQMAQYLEHKPAVERWLVYCQDVLGELWRRRVTAGTSVLRAVLGWELKRLQSWESSMLARADRVLVVSEQHQRVLAAMGVRNVSVAYPKTALRVNSEREHRSVTPSIAFFGALDRSENEDAVLWFAKDIWPRLLSRQANAEFVVIGAKPSSRIRRLQSIGSGIRVTGYIDDPTKLLQRAWIAVAPLRLGSGLKIKVLECLAQGVAVVATDVGGEGIPASETNGLLIARGAEEFVETCAGLLKSRALCEQTGEAAALWYRRVYSEMALSDEQLIELVRC